MPAKNKVTISVRLEPALAKRMKKLAKAADRSVSWYIARIIEDRIDIEESQIKAILEGEAAADQGQFVDLDEVFADLERKYARKNKRARSA
ncbi:MAG: ribbon-helix-helix protein, CopG family [Planctomycetes bacterium]|nr:ribbon-helix-helix protein, CopG family [Planctomycetota bacterium]MCB9935786.1 ribbon-helix-helix protein, CopG family [Planctomycetota bacterium]